MINYKGRLISFLKRTTTGTLVSRWRIRLWDATFSIYFIMYIEQKIYLRLFYTRSAGTCFSALDLVCGMNPGGLELAC